MRLRLGYGLLLVLFSFFVIRLFYLQVIKHNYYKQSALHGQLKEYEVPAARGVIEAYLGSETTPIVLNETKYTLFADPQFIDNPDEVAAKIQKTIGGDASSYSNNIIQASDKRYVVLAKKLSDEQKNAINELKLKGIGTREASYRTYPQGDLAAQILGFVNDSGQGTYGVEQALDEKLKGEPGLLKAITDANGVPLASNPDNILVSPKAGTRIVLSIDIGMQQQIESLLKNGLKRAKSKSGSALVIEANTGAVKAMANYPSYNPAKFFEYEDSSIFTNPAVSSPLEVGSIMKPLTLGAALNTGSVNKNSGYFDPGVFVVDGWPITNVGEVSGSGQRSVTDIIRLSLNTGATWLLKQMGDGEINQKARETWHEYMAEHYRLGKLTGIEQGYESPGVIPDPNEGFGLNIRFANSAFGQGMSATPLQMAGALASLINGGTYYKPTLIDSFINSDSTVEKRAPEVVNNQVVSQQTSGQVRSIMEYAFEQNHVFYGMKKMRPDFSIGGKTGTAQISKPDGGYFEDKFNGTFMGFVGGDEPQYVIVVRVNEPEIAGYAGSRAAAPLFIDIAEALIDDFGVNPKRR